MNRVRMNETAGIEQSPLQDGRSRRLCAKYRVNAFCRNQMMGVRARSTYSCGQRRHLLDLHAFDEFFETSKFQNV